MTEFNVVLGTTTSFGLNMVYRNVLAHYWDLNQLADYQERYNEVPKDKSAEYMANYNYNKELDRARTIFDEDGLKAKLLNDLCAFMWTIVRTVNQAHPDIDLSKLNIALKDSKTKRSHDLPRLASSSIFGAIQRYFTMDGQFIPKFESAEQSLNLLEQILTNVLDMCSLFNMSFYDGFEEFANDIIAGEQIAHP